MRGRRADQAVEPAEEHLAAAPVADPLDPQAEPLEPRPQGAGGDVDEVAGRVEGEPAAAEGPRLEAVEVGDGDDHDAARGEAAGRRGERLGRLGQVLERVPEDDRGPAARSGGLGGAPPSRSSSRSVPVAARPRRRNASSSAPSPAPTSSTAPAGAIRSMRPASDPRVQRSSASPTPGEAARVRSIGAGVGAVELRRRRPRVGGADAAAPAADQAGQRIAVGQRPPTPAADRTRRG